MHNHLSRIQDWESLGRDAGFRPPLLADLCLVSLRELERFFSARFNQTPLCWLRRLKCHLARELLAQGWSNRAVVTELGFGNDSHLCHEFKRFFGVPPGSFSTYYRTPHALSLFNPQPNPACRPARVAARPSRTATFNSPMSRHTPSQTLSLLDNPVAFRQSLPVATKPVVG
jgi:AraC-like DNA-binding protein